MIESLGLLVAVLVAVPVLYGAGRAWRRSRRADLVMWLDRSGGWAFVVENRGAREARAIVVTPLQTPRGTVTVKNISDGLKIAVLSPEGEYRIAAMRELLNAQSPAIFEVRWTDPNGKERRQQFPFYA